MKKTILTAIAMCCAVGVFAQGTVVFNNRLGATTHIYGTLGSQRLSGNAANDNPAGSTVYGSGYYLIGTAGAPANFAASTTYVSFLGAAGALASDATVTNVANLGTAIGGGYATTFRTGAGSGNFPQATATFNAIPKDAPVATFELVAWDDSSGLYSTWALASAAWNSGLIAAGKSDLFQLTSIGGDVNTPPNLTTLTSFSIYVQTVPEPTTIALAGLGAAALVVLRRRK